MSFAVRYFQLAFPWLHSDSPIILQSHYRINTFIITLICVGGGGFEPPKAKPTDLQSAPFDRSGIPPDFYYFDELEPMEGLEPPTS